MALSSCVQDAIEPLTGKYEKPVRYELNKLVKNEVVKGEQTRTFNIILTNDSATLDIKFVGNKYFLPENGYTAAAADVAKNGNYLVGAGGSTFTVNGNTVNIENGTISVKQEEGQYTFQGTVWLADESVVSVSSKVELVYEADPEPIVMTQAVSTRNNVKDGGKTVTINLATADVTKFEFDWVTWAGFIGEGTGQVFSLDLYSTDGYMHEGTYTAGDSNALEEGQFGTTYSLFGMVPNHGTCLWDVNNGVVTPTEITAGTVTVTRKGSKWEIEYKHGEGKNMVWVTFAGAIDDLTDPSLLGGGNADDTDYVELSTLLSATSNVANGTKSLTINMGVDGLSSTTDPTTWQTTWEGEGNYLALDIYSEDGKLYTGTYNAGTTGGAIAAGEFGIGWDPGDLWGIGIVFENWGTCWWNVAGGAATAAGKVTDGTVEVAVEGSDLVIKLKSSLVNAKFTCPVADFTLEVVNLGGNDAPEFEGVELTTLLSATSNVANGTKSVTINLGEDGISSTTDPTTWQTTWEGEGHYLALDVYSEDGKLAPGTYTACAVGGTINAGEFGIGWDPGDLWGIGMVFENWGTCWWNVAGGAAVAEAKVLDGTLTVAVDGDTYTITLESSAVNAQYVGPMTL